MEILRVPPYPITTTWDVPEANHAYTIYVEDVVDHSFETLAVTSNDSSQIEYILPRAKIQYDRDFFFRIYDVDLFGEIVTDSNLTVYRPYVDPNTLGNTASEIAEYKKFEIIARAMIDSYLQNDSATGEGFYNHKLIVQGIGDGTDYYPIWHNPKRILKVYENNTLVFNGEDVAISVTDVSPSMPLGDTLFTTSIAHNFEVGDTVTFTGFDPVEYNTSLVISEVWNQTQFRVKKTFTNNTINIFGTVQRLWATKFAIAPNNSAIIKVINGLYNRSEQTPASLPRANGDLGPYGLGTPVSFPKGVDYTFILDVGYKAVPPDVEIATTMLIDDIKCGRNDHYSRFVTQYSTDHFDIKFDPGFLKGTGNLVVDKILDNYKGNVIKPAVI